MKQENGKKKLPQWTRQDRDLIWYALDILESDLSGDEIDENISVKTMIVLGRIERLRKKLIEYRKKTLELNDA